MIDNVTEYLEASARKYPNKDAFCDGESSVTFNELLILAKNMGSVLTSRLNARNKPVAVFLGKNIKSIVSFLGTIYSGNFYVPVDISQPRIRLVNLFKVLNPAAIIVDDTSKKLLDGIAEPSLMVDYESLTAASVCPAESDSVKSSAASSDPLYIIFTSGSTGVPKGVCISHRSVIDYIEWAKDVYNFNDGDSIGGQAPFYFDNSVLDIYSTLKNGCTMHIIPDRLFAFPGKLLEFIKEKKITSVFWVPSVLINIANSGVLKNFAYDGLKRILFAGEVMPNKQLNVWRSFFPNILFSNLYGPTEITVDCAYYIVDRDFADDEPLPIGYACKNTDVFLLDEQDMRITDANRGGEICVRGISLALGYYNNSGKTAEVFTQNPLNPYYPELIYRTGDLGYYNDFGELVFTGRKDSQIKHMGYRLELGEVERYALSVEGIRRACVLYNREKQAITMFYESDSEYTPGFIRTSLGGVLPKYALPTVFYFMKELPETKNGKIDRHKLTEIMLNKQ